MYNIENKSNIYYLWDTQKQTESKIGDYDAVVRLIASCYREKLWIDWRYKPILNPILDSYGCNKNDGDKEYQIYDGLGRTINPRIFEKEAWALYKKGIRAYLKKLILIEIIKIQVFFVMILYHAVASVEEVPA